MQTQFDTAKVNIYVFDTGDIMTASTMGHVGYYWISNEGVVIFNDTNENYFLEVPYSKGKPVTFDYLKFTVSDPTPFPDEIPPYAAWFGTEPLVGELSDTEKQYLISDSEISNRYSEVIAWLSGASQRS